MDDNTGPHLRVVGGSDLPGALVQRAPLKEGGGGGTSGGMEARVAKLEAHMENVRAELAKLAAVPADIATVKERTAHLPTKADVKAEITAAVDRAAGRTQRVVTIAASLAALAVAAANNLPRLFGW